MIRANRTTLGACAAFMLFFAAGCGHMPHVAMPWHHTPPPPPEEVHELVITTPDGSVAAYPQYWKRNTLLVDLRGVAGTGSIVLKPREHTVWPVRLAFRVMPGQIGILEIRADVEDLMPITTQGTRPIDLELTPGVYTLKSPQITVKWEPRTEPH